MRQMLFLSLIIASSAFMECSSQPPKSPHVSAEGKDVKVTYGQPSKRGREIFGGIVPFNKVWRTGADEASEITFARDVVFGDKPVKAGTYTLYTIPTANEWTVILNPELKQWGAYEYEKVKAKNIAETKAAVKKTSAVVEKLTYRFDSANNLVIEWDNTQVQIPVKAG